MNLSHSKLDINQVRDIKTMTRVISSKIITFISLTKVKSVSFILTYEKLYGQIEIILRQNYKYHSIKWKVLANRSQEMKLWAVLAILGVGNWESKNHFTSTQRWLMPINPKTKNPLQVLDELRKFVDFVHCWFLKQHAQPKVS